MVSMTQKGDTISIEIKTKDHHYWEIMNDKKAKVNIQLRFKKTSTTGINTAGCVVLAVGELENESLVEK